MTGARVPGLRFHIDGLRVDLSTVATGAVPPVEAVTRRAELGEAAATALSAVSDADAVLAAADPHRSAFTELARDVNMGPGPRTGLGPCGGLPGPAWSVLAAHTRPVTCHGPSCSGTSSPPGQPGTGAGRSPQARSRPASR
ncbi:hypothetical protein NKH18_30775 [Streptomyces sp. M10(2022)]